MRVAFNHLSLGRWVRLSVVLMLVLLTGCAVHPGPNSHLKPTCSDLPFNSTQSVLSPGPGFVSVEYEIEQGGYCTVNLPADNYTLGVTVQWSNGWREYIELVTHMDFRSETLYRIRALETGHEKTLLQDLSFNSMTETQGAIMGATILPFVIVGAIVASPILIFMSDEEEGPYARPSETCCFVWLEKLPSGDVIGGLAPE
ncbi:hypothetical protein [Neptuniibacter sp. CAU 1671]|uniref:hypothetical protein n=1 Tax=Neptuniibacter sp. CAU 1671 TaxID=3032593 RepID=UPI0023DAAFC1|nr:hypothetical protein [Neptuniibacter sp. CAU 1671]MDF2183129.1 hypothetical protein [Neptuniibacter sp. CAU 1671]